MRKGYLEATFFSVYVCINVCISANFGKFNSECQGWLGMGGNDQGWPEIEPRRLGNTLFLKEMYPVHGGTHSANWEMLQDMAEHTLLTGNRPGTWRNTL